MIQLLYTHPSDNGCNRNKMKTATCSLSDTLGIVFMVTVQR
jgi:hypothetical protein